MRMYSGGFFIFVFILFLNSPAFCEESDIFVLCKKDKVVRWLKVSKLQDGKCQAVYSKEGFLQIISSATYFSMCEGVMSSVQKNLEEGGFKCAEQAQYSVLELD